MQSNSSSAARRARLVKICERLPEADGRAGGRVAPGLSHSQANLCLLSFDHHGDGIIGFTCKSSLSEQRRLVKGDPESFFVPPYLGSKGWIAIRLDLVEVDWDTITELARRAYQDLAPRKLAALVD